MLVQNYIVRGIILLTTAAVITSPFTGWTPIYSAGQMDAMGVSSKKEKSSDIFVGIVVIVKDSDGNPIEGAEINVLFAKGSKKYKSTTTKKSGRAIIPLPRPCSRCRYVLTVSADGYDDYRTDITRGRNDAGLAVTVTLKKAE